jgi:2-aminoadipate transaminase
MIDYEPFLSRAAQSWRGSAIRKMGALAARIPDVISFAAGYPDPDVFPWAALEEIARELLEGRDGAVLQYGPTRGLRSLLGALREILASRGIRAAEENLLVTTGSQQGLDLVSRVLLDPGDVVVVELPAYTGAIAAFRNAQATPVGVRQNDDGIDLDDLERVVAEQRAVGHRVRFIYVVPNFQNPTGRLMRLEGRRELLRWATERSVLIVEDDPYGELYFEGSAMAAETLPIKAHDEDGRVIYLSSFSKTLAPGLRVAWIAAPEPLVEKLEQAKQAADLMTGSLDQRIAFEALKRGVWAERLPALRAHYQHKRVVMEGALRAELGGVVSWPEPRGGFFLWVALPEKLSADRLLARALDQRVIYVVGSAFFVDESGSNMMRLSFSLPSVARIEAGVARLARVVREALAG